MSMKLMNYDDSMFFSKKQNVAFYKQIKNISVFIDKMRIMFFINKMRRMGEDHSDHLTRTRARQN